MERLDRIAKANPPTVLASITFAATDFPPETEDNFEFADDVDPGFYEAVKHKVFDNVGFNVKGLDFTDDGFRHMNLRYLKENARAMAISLQMAHADDMIRLGIEKKDDLYFFYPPPDQSPAAQLYVPPPVEELYVRVDKDGQTVTAAACYYPVGVVVTAISGNRFRNNGTHWVRTDDEETEVAKFTGLIADDDKAIAKRLKDIEPKYPSPKPPYGSLDTWAAGTVRAHDGWNWRWNGTAWKREGPAW